MSNRYPNLVQEVIDFITEVRKQFPDVKDFDLYNNGAISYMNGNDGTDFDWEVNNRLCEFGIGVADDSVYAFKCLINKDGSADCYCYPHGEMRPVKEINKQLFSSSEARELKDIMMKVADDEKMWDKQLNQLFY